MALALVCAFVAAPADAQTAPRVLVLHSYHPQYEWTARLMQGLRDELVELPDEHLHVEFMDARRMLDDEAYLSLLVQVYAHKYARFPPDIIISSDDSALDFLREHRDELFPGVPVVFCGINSIPVAELESMPNATGILEGLEIEGNLELIARLHPRATRIVLLADRTSLGAGMVGIARGVIPRFEAPNRTIEIWDDFTLAELDTRVRGVGPGTVFLLLAIHQDREGRYFSFDEHLRPLTEHSTAPVYGMFGMLLGDGVVGGMMNDPYEHGRATAVIARQVLAGTPADRIPVVPNAAYRPRFDYAQLERFGIAEDSLPAGSVVVGRPASFYQEHVALVWSVVAIIVVLVIAIVWLVGLIRRMKRAERELVAKQAELRRAQQLEVIGRLAGGIAHDFNNLITVISGFTVLAARRASPQDPELRDHLEQIDRATERAANLTRQLLAFARRQPVQPRVIDVNELVLDMHKLLRRLISEAIELVILPASEPACVRADPGQLEQVLSNFAINARDAMPEGGRLTIAVSIEGREVVLRTTDTGKGMTDEVKARIFEPFFTTKDVGQGTGLGLATSIGIVEQAQGSLHVESALGRGTTFTLRLPRCLESAVEQSSRRAASSVAPGEGLVLVVEDDPQIRRVARSALEADGFEIIEADNGAAALELVRRHRARLRCVLTDVVMPIMGGADLVRRLRAEATGVPIVVMSGYVDDPSLLGDAVALGLRFIAKPFVLEELVRAVREAARQRASEPSRDHRARGLA